LLIVGVLMLLPAACTLVRSAPADDDAGVAFTEVVRTGSTLAAISRRNATKSVARCRGLHRARTSPVATFSAAKRSSVPLRM
jgi:hypothetical protein